MKAISIIGIFAIILSACMTQQKAVSYLSKRQLLPQVCADSFPVIPKIDSFWTVEMYEDSAKTEALENEINRLKKEKEYLDTLPTVIDSSTCLQLREMLKANNKRYTQKYDSLLSVKSVSVEPDHSLQSELNTMRKKLSKAFIKDSLYHFEPDSITKITVRIYDGKVTVNYKRKETTVVTTVPVSVTETIKANAFQKGWIIVACLILVIIIILLITLK